MTPWRDTFLAFTALGELGTLMLAPQPAWVWSRDGSRILWANPAGGARLEAENFAALAKRRWPEGHPLRRELRRLIASLPEKGSLARLRLPDDLYAMPSACRCRRTRAGEERGILVVAVEGRAAPSPAALAAFYSGDDVEAGLFDETGTLLAGSEGATAGPSAEFGGSVRKLRLHLAQRDPVVQEPPDAISADEPEAEDVEVAQQAPAEPEQQTPAESVKHAPAEPVQRPPAVRVPDAGLHPAEALDLVAAELTRLAPRSAAPAKAGAAPETGRRAFEIAEVPRGEPVRAIMAGRVPREISRNPVRFLWQTDAAERFLFVSPGLAQVVGRNAEVVGERWQDLAARLRLDPSLRIARAFAQRDTWSGLTAWWPIEGSNVRAPAELTALPIFGGDHSFQGFRGFGVLRPAEALMPAAFEARFGTEVPARPAEQIPPYEEAVATTPANVVPIRADIERMVEHARLTPQERSAFEEIAAMLRERVIDAPVAEEDEEAPPASPDADRADIKETEEGEEDAETGVEPAAAAAQDLPPATPAPAPSHTPHRVAVSMRGDGDSRRLLREMTAILDTATDGVVTLDAAGSIESANASAEALFGLDASEMEGRAFADLLTRESAVAALDYLSGLRDNGVASLLNEGREVEARAGAGSIPLFMTMGRLSSEAGGRFCAVLRDITHWKRSEAELVAARRAAEVASQQKSEFLARVSHEIRTPLSAIIGFAELMIEERFGPMENERYREYLRDIRTSGEHVVSLVNDLLDISKIEAGKVDLHFAAVPLNDLVRESIALMQPQANRARVVLRSSLSREVPGIVADQRTLRQIVLNLLSNSVKFTGPGGQVIASTSLAESGEALLRVRDTGEGMSEEELQRALEPFRQIATSTLSGRTGTGLGLPLTKALVEANRATLSIKSARGEGTVVTVTFPPTRVLSE